MEVYHAVIILGCSSLFLEGSPLDQPIQSDSHQVTKRAVECYGQLGCFDSSDFFHITYRPIHDVPQPRNTINTQFTLFTRSNQADAAAQLLLAGDTANLHQSHFRFDRHTKLIIHGYTGNARDPWVMEMKDAFLVQGDYNVVCVDWEQGALGLYNQAATNTWLVGAEIALLIQFLQAELGAALSDFHLVGHSLGAHVSGYAGARLTGLTRITGLDPADPLFQNLPATVRLDPTDAMFVDVIHSDANHILGILAFEGGFGMKDPVGHVDFYPNGGKDQPGCDSHLLEKVWTTVTGDLSYVKCDHVRAVELMIESIHSQCDMVATPCQDYKDFKILIGLSPVIRKQNSRVLHLSFQLVLNCSLSSQLTVKSEDIAAGLCLDCGSVGCGVMGYKADQFKPPAGMVNVKYYLNTGSRSPFCVHHLLVTVSLSSKSPRETGTLRIKLFSDTDVHSVLFDPDKLEAGTGYKSELQAVTGIWGNVIRVQVWYDCVAPWWKFWSCWGSHSIRLDTVEVFQLESQARSWFCGSGIRVEDGKGPVELRSSLKC